MSAVQFKVGDRVHSPKLGEFVIGSTFTTRFGQVNYLPKGGRYANGTTANWGVPACDLILVEAKPTRDYVADHARRTLRKAGLSKEEARQVVANWNSGEYSLNSLSRRLPIRLSALLMEAFTWYESPEGEDYWYKVYARELMKEQNAKAQ